MSDDVRLGVEIDSGIWKRFRQDIESRRGHIRGHLSTELETAIQQYLDDHSDPTLNRIETKVDYLAGQMDVDIDNVPAPSHDADEHTHAEPDAPESRPAPQASTDKKTRWLASCVIDEIVPNAREITEVPRSALRDIVKDEYGFRSDTAKRYVERLTEYFDLTAHPDVDSILVSEDRLEEIREEKKQTVRQEAEAKL